MVPPREYVRNREWQLAAEYVDHGVSGSKASRPELDRLMKDARALKVDVIVVARFDRFARSTRPLILALEEFQSLGLDFISLNESIDTSTAMGKMVFTVLGAVAELERNIIRERVAAGLQRAKKEGKKLGRPKVIVDREKVRDLHGKATVSAPLLPSSASRNQRYTLSSLYNSALYADNASERTIQAGPTSKGWRIKRNMRKKVGDPASA